MLLIPMGAVLACQTAVVALLAVPLGPARRGGMALAGAAKSRYGRVAARTVAVCLALLLASSLFSVQRLQARLSLPSAMGGTSAGLVDKVELLEDAMEALLIGFSLLLGILIGRLHHEMKNGDSLKVNLEMLKKQAKGMETEYLRLTKERSGQPKDDETDPQLEREKALKATITDLRSAFENVKAEVEVKAKDLKQAEASVAALKKQTHGLQLEYDRLLDDNSGLRAQLSILSREYSSSDDKKMH